MPDRDGGLPGLRRQGPPGVDPDALGRDDTAARPLGGTVEQTGIALVRRGETVVPGPGAAARLRGTALGSDPVVTIEVPVTVEVGPSMDEVTERAATLALRRLREALEARSIG